MSKANNISGPHKRGRGVHPLKFEYTQIRENFYPLIDLFCYSLGKEVRYSEQVKKSFIAWMV